MKRILSLLSIAAALFSIQATGFSETLLESEREVYVFSLELPGAASWQDNFIRFNFEDLSQAEIPTEVRGFVVIDKSIGVQGRAPYPYEKVYNIPFTAKTKTKGEILFLKFAGSGESS